jgi:hypothetical protein
LTTRLLPGRRQRGRVILAVLFCAACTPSGGLQDDPDAAKLGEEQAITRAAEMLEAHPPAEAPRPAAPPAEQR